MKITLARNIGTDDLRRFGVLTGSDPEDLRDSLATYSKGKTVDAPEHFHDYLTKRGLGAVEVKGVSRSPSVKGVPDESPISDTNVAEAVEQIGNMRSKDKLQHIIDNDPRVPVKDAAKKRLASL